MAEKKEFSVWDPAIAVPFIKSNEGCRLASYRDPAGVWTVGYGSTRLASGNPVIRDIKITQEEADELLESELYRLRDVLFRGKPTDSINHLRKERDLTYRIIASF